MFELPAFWAYMTLAMRGSLFSERGAHVVVASLASYILVNVVSRFRERLTSANIVFSIMWGAAMSFEIEYEWFRPESLPLFYLDAVRKVTGWWINVRHDHAPKGEDNETRVGATSLACAAFGSDSTLPEQSMVMGVEPYQLSATTVASNISALSQPHSTQGRTASEALASQISLETLSDQPSASDVVQAKPTSPQCQHFAMSVADDASVSNDASKYRVDSDSHVDSPIDELCAQAAKQLMRYADEDRDFALQRSFPSLGIVIAKKDVKNSLPIIRGRLMVDTALLPGDPKALWEHLAEFAAVCTSHSCKTLYDEKYLKARVLQTTSSSCVLWMGQRQSASGTAYDYVTACMVRASSGRISVVYTSVPEELIPDGGACLPGFTRNTQHLGGFDVRHVGETAGGLSLRVSYILHYELAGLSRATLASLLGPEGPLLDQPICILSRVHELISTYMRPEDIALAEDASDDLYPVLANLMKPLNVARFLHAVLASRSHRMTARPDSNNASLSSADSSAISVTVSPHPVLENLAEVAYCNLRDVLECESEWERQDVGIVGVGIATSIRNIAGSKWPMYQSKVVMELPARFNNSLQSAVIECALLYMSHSGQKMIDAKYDKSVILRRCQGCEAVWRGLMPQMSRDPLDFMLARCLRVSASLEGVDVLFASTSMSPELAEEILGNLPEDASFLPQELLRQRFQRSRLGLSGFRIRGTHRQGETPQIELSYVVNPILNMGGALQKVPEFLIRKEHLLLPNAWLSRFRELFAQGLAPEVIARSGGHGASLQPRIIGPSVTVNVAGHSRNLDEWTYDALKPLLENA